MKVHNGSIMSCKTVLACPEAEVFFQATYTPINIIEACPKLSHSSLKHLWTCPKVSYRNEIKTSFISISTVTNTFYSALLIFFLLTYFQSLFSFFPSPSFPIPQKKRREIFPSLLPPLYAAEARPWWTSRLWEVIAQRGFELCLRETQKKYQCTFNVAPSVF